MSLALLPFAFIYIHSNVEAIVNLYDSTITLILQGQYNWLYHILPFQLLRLEQTVPKLPEIRREVLEKVKSSILPYLISYLYF